MRERFSFPPKRKKNMKTKICTKCKKEKTLDQFYKGIDKDNLTYPCKDCIKIYYKENKVKINEYRKIYDLTSKRIYGILKNNTRNRGKELIITEEDFVNWYNNQEKICHYCKRTLEEIKQDIKENKKFKNRLSIDRKDNNKGYTLDNMALACRRCNSIKSDYFTEQEMIEIGKLLKRN